MPIKKLKKTNGSTKRAKPLSLPPLPEIQQEIHHHYYPRRPRRFDFGKLSLGLFLIVLGILYLAKLTGWLTFDFQIAWWQLWPLLIIFFGLSLLTGRTVASIFAGVILTLTVLTITLILLLGQTGSSFSVTTGSSGGAPTTIGQQTFPVNIVKDPSATGADFVIKSNFSNLTLSGGAEQLAAGQLNTNFSELIANSQVADNRQIVNLEVRPVLSRLGTNVSLFNLQLNGDSTNTIYLESVASTVNFNLAKLASHLTNIKAIASSVNLDLTDAPGQLLEISAQASQVNLTLSDTTAIRLTFKNQPDFSSDKFKKLDAFTYETPAYRDSGQRIDINLDLTAGNLKIN
jgi:hypothetical protein